MADGMIIELSAEQWREVVMYIDDINLLTKMACSPHGLVFTDAPDAASFTRALAEWASEDGCLES